MKKIFLTKIILIVTISLSIAQLDVFFKDDFDNNKNNWYIFDEDGASAKINNGTMIMECKDDYASYRFWKSINLNIKKDFYIQIRIKQISGNKNEGSGIVWGAKGWSNSFNFDVSADGYYKIYGYKNEKLFYIKRKTKYSKINSTGLYNTIAIHKKADKLFFYINCNKVYSTKFRTFFGNYIGFIAGNGTKIMADYITIKHHNAKINLVSKSVSKYSKKNMGLNINSQYSEIAPIIAPDGKTLYISRNDHPNNIGGKSKYDIWYSKLKPNGKWSKIKNIGKPLNNAGDNVVIAVSPDNNTLWLETLYNNDGSYKNDKGISISQRTKNGWSIPKKIVIKNYYNRDIYESFCPTVDRKVLIMSCKRDDGYGEKDMWVSFLTDNGTYSEPQNMGAIINSYNEEGTPYIAPDNKTLYFYSYTEPGYGSADIFVTKRLDETWTKWSEPKNLGKKINTNDWDVYYTVAAKGDYAYLVSSKNSYGNEDIFNIKLTEEEKPEPVILIEGKVFDRKTGKPIGTSIVYENTETGKITGHASSNPVTGEYKIILPFGIKYQIRTTKKDYFAISEMFDLRNFSEYKEIKKDLLMIPLEKGKAILLKNVLFYSSKATLMPGSYSEINRLAKIMNENPSMIIELQGHTELSIGYEKKLMELSKKRVKTVKNYLIKKGVEAERIKEKAFGGTKPITSNKTKKEKAKNRRVEFVILKK